MKTLCARCAHELTPEAVSCPACNFVGPGAGVAPAENPHQWPRDADGREVTPC